MNDGEQLNVLLSLCVEKADAYILAVSKAGQYDPESARLRLEWEKSEQEYADCLSSQKSKAGETGDSILRVD